MIEIKFICWLTAMKAGEQRLNQDKKDKKRIYRIWAARVGWASCKSFFYPFEFCSDKEVH